MNNKTTVYESMTDPRTDRWAVRWTDGWADPRYVRKRQKMIPSVLHVDQSTFAFWAAALVWDEVLQNAREIPSVHASAHSSVSPLIYPPSAGPQTPRFALGPLHLALRLPRLRYPAVYHPPIHAFLPYPTSLLPQPYITRWGY